MLKNFLTIDTSTHTLYVSLVVEETVVFTFQKIGNKDHAIRLMPAVIEAFEVSRFDPQKLDAIVVGEGPGSYTGVRMGVVVAKTLAIEWQKPLYKISSLLLSVSGVSGVVAAVIDARRDHLFAAVYDLGELIQTQMEPVYCSKEQLNQAHPDAYQPDHYQPDVLRLNRLNAFERVNDVKGLSPLYLRQTQAESEL